MQQIKLTALGYNARGEAITRFANKIFYVPGLILNEAALCVIEYQKATYGRAKLLKLLTASPHRNYQVPNNHLLIGGYELLHMDDEAQTEFKMQKIKNDFQQIAKCVIPLQPLVKGLKRFRYRNKITLHDGGFYEVGTHQVHKIRDFLLTDIVATTNQKGTVIKRQLDTLIEGHKNVQKYTTDTLLGLQFRVGLNSFYQVNSEIAALAYTAILAAIAPDEIVLDLYSGIGTIALLAAQKARYVYAADWSKSNYADALYNQRHNQVQNVKFWCTDVLQMLQKLPKKVDTIVVDPARAGLGRDVCALLLKINAPKIIYLSCNPGTQARDFQILKSNYQIAKAQPFDMFPQTYHIENLLILTKKT